ncbi:MAG: DNA polymerase III subunit gamma/tau [Candidatus Nitrospinota bacterium M3_3B_026]
MEEKHTVSALKFRPRTFSEVVGQPHIVRTLTNAIDKKRIAHAYLFSGVRGVGKTSMARILAKALNCEKGPTAAPCLECRNCVEIASGSSMDVYEIDGASNRGIDNIRELREKVRFAPAKSRYKVYIIDEVHQITKEAFNALLKTLEEPPPHVVFIFATTELSKVPDTILSRCQSYEYKTISARDITAQLDMIAEKEKIDASPAAVEVIARRARGSMRDAQSLFDQAAAYGGGSVTEEDVKLILGMAPRTVIAGVMDAATAQDRAEILKLAGEVTLSGADPVLFLEDLMETVRDIMAAKINPETLAGMEAEERDRLSRWAGEFGYDEIHRFFNVLVETQDQTRRSHQPSLNLEMGLLRLAEKRGAVSIDTLLEKAAGAGARVEKAMESAEDAPKPEAAPSPPAENNPPGPDVAPAPPSIRRAVEGGGGKLVELFKREINKPMLNGIFDAATVKTNDDAVIITVNSLFERESLEETKVKSRLEKIASRELGARARVVVMVASDEGGREDEEVKKKRLERETDMKQKMHETPIVQAAMELFDGEIAEMRVARDA